MYKSISSYDLKSATDGHSLKVGAARGNFGNGGGLQKSYTVANCTVEKTRGFKPSDRHDPTKRQFLTELSKQIWQKAEESTNISKKIDLNKIFTPATDTEEILPKNRKLYASSAFYSPALHPTVEDQVELARRISNSLSDISNQKSKGQSMYVNRKKRSVKWVHEGQGQGQTKEEEVEQQQQQADSEYGETEEFKENSSSLLSEHVTATHTSSNSKIPLRFLMNPCGQMRDYASLRESMNIETGLLSPDKCAEVVSALQSQKSRGAELFAKRRKKSEKWIVDESTTINPALTPIAKSITNLTPTNATTNTPIATPSTIAGTESPSYDLTDFHHYQPKPPASPSIVPAYSDAGKHRVQLNMHQEQLLEKYAKPSLRVVKTPWEAALETGSASTAFVEETPVGTALTPSSLISSPPAALYDDYRCTASPYRQPASGGPGATVTDYGSEQQKFPTTNAAPPPSRHSSNYQRDLAYKPSLPQGWKAPSMTLPKVAQAYEQLNQQQQEQWQHAYDIQQQQQQWQREHAATATQIQQQQYQMTATEASAEHYVQEQQQQQQQQQQREFQQHFIREAAKSCEIFNSTDEEEMVGYINHVELQRMQQQQQQLQVHEFVDHLIRSPELCVSPLPAKNLLLYDNAVQELQQQQQHQQHRQQQNTIRCNDTREEEQMPAKRVDVRKQLQQFEEYQHQLTTQEQQEKQLFLLREQRTLARQQQKLCALQEQQQQKQQQQPNEHQQQQQPHQQQQQAQQLHEAPAAVTNDDYKQVPVRDLIVTFEQQAQAQTAAVTEEQQLLQLDKRQKLTPQQHNLRQAQTQQQLQQQQQQQQQPQQQQPQTHSSYDHSSHASIINHNAIEHCEVTNNAALYVPKEIPLESYAPPPVATPNLSTTSNNYANYNWPTSDYGTYSGADHAAASKPSHSFPVSHRPSGQQVSFSAPISAGAAGAAPKQQYWAPTSYQTVPQQTGQGAPPVNFNPSPLPYDKLAKFDQPNPDTSYYSPPASRQRLYPPGVKYPVRNSSPIPFGNASAPARYSPSAAPPRAAPISPYGGSHTPLSSVSPRPPSSQNLYGGTGPTTPQHSPLPATVHAHAHAHGTAASRDLLHAPTYNTPARGWGASGSGAAARAPASYQSPQRFPSAAYSKPAIAVHATGHMPYTDF